MKKKLEILLITLCTSSAFFLNIEGIYKNQISSSNIFTQDLFVVTFVFFLLAGWYHHQYRQKTTRSETILAIILSFFMIFGKSYLLIDSWDLVFGNLLLFILSIFMAIGYFFLFKSILSFLAVKLENYALTPLKKIKNKYIRRFLDLFERHPFLTSLVILLLCWLIYIIAFYPIILSPDPSFQIKQYFNEHTKYIDWVIQRDPNVNMTTHHPVIHTVLLGGCIQLGRMILNDNFGLFLYSLLQTLTLASVFAYTISYTKKVGIPNKYRLILLAIYALVPMFPLYAMSGVKDTYYTAFIILYVLVLFDLIHFKQDKKISLKYALWLLLVITLITLFRNNGLYVVVLSLPFLIFTNKKSRGRLAVVCILFLAITQTYSKVLIPALGISEGSIREVLSLPFQQTARYVKEHGDEIKEEEKELYDKILGYDDLAERYDPEKADPVKNMYNKNTTNEELSQYFHYWLQGLIKHPDTYIQATMNNVYGYFYPNSTKWYVYYKYDDRITQNDLVDYHYNNLGPLRQVLSSFGVSFPYIPVLGLLANVGFSSWLMFLMICYFIDRKMKKYIIVLSPLLVSLLVCIASPVNTYFRYAMPYVFVMPALVLLMLKVWKEGKKSCLKKKEK